MSIVTLNQDPSSFNFDNTSNNKFTFYKLSNNATNNFFESQIDTLIAPRSSIGNCGSLTLYFRPVITNTNSFVIFNNDVQNQIQITEKNIFTNDIFYLKVLNLTSQNINQINDESFNGLVALSILYLNNNSISYLEPLYWFYEVDSNGKWELKNSIRLPIIKCREFLENLKNLSLSNNYINFIDSNSFINLSNLINLKLKYNKLN